MAAEYQRRTGTEIPAPPTPEGPAIRREPVDTIAFTWACKCLNVLIDGRIAAYQEERIHRSSPEPGAEGSVPQSKNLVKVWIDNKREQVRQPGYVIYDIAPEERGRIRTPSYSTGCWRLCMLCDTKIYRTAEEVGRNDPAAGNQWVDVDLAGSVYGSSLRDLQAKDVLPYSGLHLPLEASQSQFGRPPSARPKTPPVPTPPGILSIRVKGLIPIAHDPFFLPPPFVPSHPHLATLTKEATAYLQEVTDRNEADIQNYIEGKTTEMRKLEEQVRCEVEMLWKKYLESNAEAREITTRRRGSKVDSRSKSRETIRKFSPSPNASFRQKMNLDPTPGSQEAGPSSVNPITELARREPAYSGPSLISASFAANAHRPPPSASDQKDRSVANSIANTIASIEHKHDKRSTVKEQAMSHVFTSFDANMADRPKVNPNPNPSVSVVKEPTPEAIDAAKSKASKARSVSRERPIRGVTLEPPIAEESVGSVRRDIPQVEAPAYRRRQSVKFDETEVIDDDASRKADADNHDGEVFDFELEEQPPAQNSGLVGYSLDPNHLDAEAAAGYTDPADLLAASAPSHRAAWARSEMTGNPQWLDRLARERRTSLAPEDALETDDRGATTSFATSMPVDVVQPEKRRTVEFTSSVLRLERKTSLSEREAQLVPPLRSAMRQTDSGSGSGLRPPVEGPFVPPHIVVRREDKANEKGPLKSFYDK